MFYYIELLNFDPSIWLCIRMGQKLFFEENFMFPKKAFFFNSSLKREEAVFSGSYPD